MYCHGQCRVMYRFAGASLDRTRGCHRLLIESCFDSFCIPLSTTELMKERLEKREKRKEKKASANMRKNPENLWQLLLLVFHVPREPGWNLEYRYMYGIYLGKRWSWPE